MHEWTRPRICLHPREVFRNRVIGRSHSSVSHDGADGVVMFCIRLATSVVRLHTPDPNEQSEKLPNISVVGPNNGSR